MNQLLMFNLFERLFSFKAILFSHSPSIVRFARRQNVTVISEYQTNPFDLPYVRDLYLQASHRFHARFYGYLNSDIILSPSIFSLLQQVTRRMDERLLPRIVGETGG